MIVPFSFSILPFKSVFWWLADREAKRLGGVALQSFLLGSEPSSLTRYSSFDSWFGFLEDNFLVRLASQWVRSPIYFARLRQVSGHVGKTNLVWWTGILNLVLGFNFRHARRLLKLSSWIHRRANARVGRSVTMGLAVSCISWVCYFVFHCTSHV